MNKTMLDYKNTMAMLAFFSLTAAFADAAIISRLRHAGAFLGLRTGFWKAMYSASGLIFMGLVLAHIAYRKDKIMFIKECMKYKESWR